jgi:GDSL-like Lipase/Acylhydrolase family
LILLGDSKTAAKPWVTTLVAALGSKTGLTINGYNGGVAGQTVASALTAMDATLAGFPADGGTTNYRHVLMNWGVNDIAGTPVEATWEANYLSIIDKIHAKAPNAKVYLMRPWDVGNDAWAATFNTWINVIVGSRAFTYVGPDEAVWLKGSDNGASETVDGVHYSTPLGNNLAAARWQTVLGY